MFVMVVHIREMAVKKSCNSGEYGSLEHLLVLFTSVMRFFSFSAWALTCSVVFQYLSLVAGQKGKWKKQNNGKKMRERAGEVKES